MTVGLFDDDPALKPKPNADNPHATHQNYPLNESAYCKFCGQPLLWVSLESGARMPLDKNYEERWITESGTSPMKARKRRTYSSHFDTCPRKAGR